MQTARQCHVQLLARLAGTSGYPLGQTCYELRGQGSMHGASDGQDDDSDTPMDGAPQLGIVRKAASCITDAVLTCARVLWTLLLLCR